MLYMVIERFKNRDAKAVYRRFREKGRMAPDGLAYVESWVETNFDRCFQLMECGDVRLLQPPQPTMMRSNGAFFGPVRSIESGSASATIYVPSAMSWLSTPKTVLSAPSICAGV